MEPLKADVVVIGGGAAGSMCALTAVQRGLSVVLLEPNKMLGKKLRITGKGRCNVTNNCDIKTVLANIPGDGRFLYSALNRLEPHDTMALFESLGVPLKTERGNRVFPVSDRSHDIANALERAYAHAGGRVLHAAATDILTRDGAVSAVVTTEGTIDCDAAVVCTGGMSYPLTGSTGDGYRFAQQFGHTGGGACFKKARLGVRADILCKGKQRFTLGVNGGKDLLFNSIHGFEPPQYGNKGRQKTAPISRSFFIRRTGRGYSDALHWPQAVRNSVHTLVWASMASAEIFWIISMLSALKSSGSVRKDWYASSMSASAAWLVQ